MNASREEFLDTAASMACVHCGLCLSACPTYLETGNENDSPRGRIYLMRALQDGRLPLGDTAIRHVDLCLGCRACEAACPSGVRYGELLEQTREHIERRHRRTWFQRVLRRIVIEKIFPRPTRMKLALLPARLAKVSGLGRLLPATMRGALALIPDRMPDTVLPELSPAIGAAQGRVGFIRGCVMSVMFGATNAASVRLLNRAGYDVVTPPNQSCCGALFAHGGNLEAARTHARQNIEAFESLNFDVIVINAAGCGSTLKEYGELLRHDSTWAERARHFSSKVKDLCEFLVTTRTDCSSDSPRSTIGPAKVTCHDACHLAHAQRIVKAPRDLVKSVAGASFVELPEADVCCGSAGSYNLTEPEMAERLQRRKIEHILRSGAEIVVTTNPGCILQIQAGLNKVGASRIKVLHIADFLDHMADGQNS